MKTKKYVNFKNKTNPYWPRNREYECIVLNEIPCTHPHIIYLTLINVRYILVVCIFFLPLSFPKFEFSKIRRARSWSYLRMLRRRVTRCRFRCISDRVLLDNRTSKCRWSPGWRPRNTVSARWPGLPPRLWPASRRSAGTGRPPWAAAWARSRGGRLSRRSNLTGLSAKTVNANGWAIIIA